MSLKNKLNRLKPHLSSGVGHQDREAVSEKTQQPEFNPFDIPYKEIWEKENVKPYILDNEYCLVREVKYPLSYKHGDYHFAQAIQAVRKWNEVNFKHPLSASGHAPGDLFFFDTETTGLGGGAGNTIFLLGYASIREDSVVLKQHILPQPGAEVALYQSFLEEIDYTTLVTYNGKAFDWPQVKTRHTLVRNHVPKLPSFGHFDLYHAARRMWKHKIERMKLSVVEKEILGFEREDDIPGYLAPMIYFDFVERKHPEGLLGVMKHNELDILSLITLYTHLSFQLLGVDKKRSVRETFEVGRWYSYLGARQMAEENFAQIADGDEMDAILAKHALAFEYKRNANYKDAVNLWEETAKYGKNDTRIEAYIELAKYYEHKSKDFQNALTYCEEAVSLLQVLENEKKLSRLQEDLQKRKMRLIAKMDRQ
ncbi:ribonuclease H-like domain-containing protein [Mesobacillus maritimus]|uniref:ribonuclease H-like domain-containing protein n=1 Tax=Mesobacillus maritimus TaxID=1643336 RepID=UPI0038509409